MRPLQQDTASRTAFPARLHAQQPATRRRSSDAPHSIDIPLQLPDVLRLETGQVGIRLEIDDVPGPLFKKRQVKRAFDLNGYVGILYLLVIVAALYGPWRF